MVPVLLDHLHRENFSFISIFSLLTHSKTSKLLYLGQPLSDYPELLSQMPKLSSVWLPSIFSESHCENCLEIASLPFSVLKSVIHTKVEKTNPVTRMT